MSVIYKQSVHFGTQYVARSRTCTYAHAGDSSQHQPNVSAACSKLYRMGPFSQWRPGWNCSSVTPVWLKPSWLISALRLLCSVELWYDLDKHAENRICDDPCCHFVTYGKTVCVKLDCMLAYCCWAHWFQLIALDMNHIRLFCRNSYSTAYITESLKL